MEQPATRTWLSFPIACVLAVSSELSAGAVTTDYEIVTSEHWAVSEDGNGHWYIGISVSNPISWSDARALAEQLGGTLATITSAAENDWVFEHIVNDPCLWESEAGPWLGGFRDPPGSDNWHWVTGEPWGFANWNPQQPDNAPCGEGCPGENHIHWWNVEAAQCGMCAGEPSCGPHNSWNDIWDDSWVQSLVVELPIVHNPANGHYYLVVANEVLWSTARAMAESMEFNGMTGHLVTISDDAENSFIVEEVMGTHVNSAYTGGRQPEGSGEPGEGWGWVNGELFCYQNWGPGQPDQNGGEDENVIELKGLSSSFPYDWHDQAGDTDLFPFVVEFEFDPHCEQDIACPGDGAVGYDDLVALLANWHCESVDCSCVGDFDCDGIVDFGDLLDVLAHWGSCIGAP